MNAGKMSAALAAAVLVIGGLVYYFNRSPVPAPVLEPLAQTQLQPLPPKIVEPEQHYPLPELTPDAPAAVPKVEETEAGFGESLKAVIGAGPLESLFVPEFLIRRIVVTIDNLPRERLPLQMLPLKRTPGSFGVRDDGGQLRASADNDARYAPLLAVLNATDPAQVVKLYLRYYPLFQKAYAELGYGDRQFNDRLVAVIDNLLATPEPQGELELLRPKVFYQFADPALEAASAGQKTLLRIGSANRAAAKTWLRQIRGLLVPTPASP